MNNRIIIDNQLLQLMLERFSQQLLENYGDFTDTVLVGMQPRGVLLSDRIFNRLQSKTSTLPLYGRLDTTFYRDDFRGGKFREAKETDINFPIEGKRVVLIDDVLFTGRTVRAALDALLDHGRPSEVKLLTLINRRFNREIPIQPDFIGLTVDTHVGEFVSVQWEDENQNSRVMLLKEDL